MATPTPATESGAGWTGKLADVRAPIVRLLFGKRSLTLFDQGLVSAASFLTTIVVGRFAGPEALGVYSLVFGISAMVLSINESLVCLPYAIQFRRLREATRRRYAGSTFLQASLMALAISMTLLIVGGVLWWRSWGDPALAVTLAVFGLTAPLVMLRDFSRRFSLAHLRPQVAVVVDGGATTLQVVALIALAATGWISAWTAHAAIGIGCGLAAGLWLWRALSSFEFRRRRLRNDLQRNWRLGRWVFASQMCSVANMYGLHWLLGWGLGTDAVGIFVGCTAVVLLSNPFMLGIANLLSPSIAEALATGAGLRRVVLETTLFLTAVMVLFCIVIAIWGVPLTVALYGETYAGQQATTIVFALGVLCMALGMPAEHALWCANHPQASFRAGLFGLIVTLITTIALMPMVGIVAAAIGILAGNACTALGRWFSIWQLGLLRETAT